MSAGNSLCTTRKSFIGGVLAAGVAPSIVPSSVFGANAPSNRITLGGVGVGGIGSNQLPMCRDAGFEVIALCDVDDEYGKRCFDKFPDARRYRDFREFFAKETDKLDAVYCGCPDHWHAIVTLEALKRRKHMCCVKPLTRRIDECRAVVAAAKKVGTATQVTACTSQDEASLRLKEIVDAGLLGQIREIHCWSRRPVWPQGMIAYPSFTDPVPAGLDWDMWIGPAKKVPYAANWPKDNPYSHMTIERWSSDHVFHPLCHRGWFEYGAGSLGDMGCHRANTIYRVVPLEWPAHVEACTTKMSDVAFPLASIVTYDYENVKGHGDIRLTWYDGGLKPPKTKEMFGFDYPLEGTLYVGTKGRVLFSTANAAATSLVFFDKSLEAKAAALPKTLERPPREVVGSNNMTLIYGEWMRACRGGKEASCNFEFAQKITEFVQLGNLAIQTRKPVEFDPVAVRITNDNPEAEKLLHCNYENGWELPQV